MKVRETLVFCAVFVCVIAVAGFAYVKAVTPNYSTQEIEFEKEEPTNQSSDVPSRFGDLSVWTRPVGPPRVGLQVGHWKNSELPKELKRLIGSTGASVGGVHEWEVNLKIAELAAEQLREHGIEVDILPATIPPSYWADLVIAIHADGNLDRSASGYKAAAPRRDMTGRATEFAELLNAEYGRITGLVYDPEITRNMRGYYAFNWRRYEHSVHPMATSVILETGFLTNAGDRRIIVSRPELSAQGIVSAVVAFLQTERR